MRLRAQTDANQAEIVRALRCVGASVELLHRVGGGCPDLLVGYRGRNFLLEIKVCKGKLNTLQERYHALWRGEIRVVRSVHEALTAIGAIGD
jgi:hypothetical protein